MRCDSRFRDAFAWATHGTALAILALGMTTASASAQTYAYRDINPSQSSLHATDPDGASGGRVNGLGRAPNGTTFFAATEWGGLYRTTDSGQNWAYLPGHVPMVSWDVEVDPSNGNRVYATSFYDGRVNTRAGINVSTDGGNTWTRPASATPPVGFCENAARRDNPSAFGIAIDPGNTNRVFIGTNCGVARSTDAGVTWTFIDPTPADGADDVWDVVVHDGIVDLCGDDGHRRSVDFGTTWTTATSNALPGARCSIAASPDEPGVLYAVAGTQIFETLNGGTSWPNAITNPQAQGRIPFVATNQRTGATFDLWFGDVRLHRATCTTPAAGSTARRCPANTWVGPFTRSAGAHDDAGDIAFATGAANDACPVLFSSDGGVFRNTLTTSPNCQSPAWTQPTVTPHALWLYAMAGADQLGNAAEDLYIGAQDNGSFGTTNASVAVPTWTNSECCDAHNFTATPARALFTICCFNPAPANRLFQRGSGLAGGGIFGNPPPGNLRSFREQDAIAHFSANGVVAITSSGVFATTNITASPPTWTQLGAATTPANAQNVYVADSSGTPVFFVLAGNGNGVTQDRLFRFTGTGTGNWAEIFTPDTTGGFGIVAVDRTTPRRIFASQLRTGLNPRMIRSTDGGATWTTLTALDNLMTGAGAFGYVNQRGPVVFGGGASSSFGGYPQPTLLAIEPGNSNVVVAGGAESGVFLSFNGGTSWELITDPNTPNVTGVPHLPRPQFAYFDREGSTIFQSVLSIYVGTQGRGVWRITRTTNHFIVVCGIRFLLCHEPKLDRNTLVLDCFRLDIERCRFKDPVPKNCLVKFDCPGCPPGGLCPPFYNFVLDGLDPEIWDVGVFTFRGLPVDHQVVRTRTGVVVSFRPDREGYREKSVGDYYLAFALRPGGKPDRYVVKASLQVGSEYFGSKVADGGVILRPAMDPIVAPSRE
jgi:photosystem II stability/assembly factor-like uncharacterized protein